MILCTLFRHVMLSIMAPKAENPFFCYSFVTSLLLRFWLGKSILPKSVEQQWALNAKRGFYWWSRGAFAFLVPPLSKLLSDVICANKSTYYLNVFVPLFLQKKMVLLLSIYYSEISSIQERELFWKMNIHDFQVKPIVCF